MIFGRRRRREAEAWAAHWNARIAEIKEAKAPLVTALDTYNRLVAETYGVEFKLVSHQPNHVVGISNVTHD